MQVEKKETPQSSLIYNSIKEATVNIVYYMGILRQSRSTFNVSIVIKYTLQTLKSTINTLFE